MNTMKTRTLLFGVSLNRIPRIDHHGSALFGAWKAQRMEPKPSKTIPTMHLNIRTSIVRRCPVRRLILDDTNEGRAARKTRNQNIFVSLRFGHRLCIP